MDPEKTKFYSAAYVEGRRKATKMICDCSNITNHLISHRGNLKDLF